MKTQDLRFNFKICLMIYLDKVYVVIKKNQYV